MPTPIPPERLAVLVKAGICGPSVTWLSVPGRTYEDLAEQPKWAFMAARYPGADVLKLQAAVIASGDVEWRRTFAKHIPGADKVALLAGLDP